MEGKLVNGLKKEKSCDALLHRGWLARLNCVIQNSANRTLGK